MICYRMPLLTSIKKNNNKRNPVVFTTNRVSVKMNMVSCSFIHCKGPLGPLQCKVINGVTKARNKEGRWEAMTLKA